MQGRGASWYTSCNYFNQTKPDTWCRKHSLYTLAVPIERLATEELGMNAIRSKSAWVALLTAGGLYAWKNRDKIQGWLNTQREQFDSQSGRSLHTTGATRRIDQQNMPPSDTHG